MYQPGYQVQCSVMLLLLFTIPALLLSTQLFNWVPGINWGSKCHLSISRITGETSDAYTFTCEIWHSLLQVTTPALNPIAGVVHCFIISMSTNDYVHSSQSLCFVCAHVHTYIDVFTTPQTQYTFIHDALEEQFDVCVPYVTMCRHIVCSL